MHFRSQNTQQHLLSNQKHYSALRTLTAEPSTITSFAISDFPNQDFVVVFEKQINGRYYLGVAKYSAQNEVLIPFSYITNSDQISNIETIDDTTSSLVFSSDAPMYAEVTSFNDGGFLVACFQGHFLSVAAKTFDATGYSKSVNVDNSGLGIFYPGSISIDQEAAARWAESVPRSLSLLSFPDNRFIITRATQMTSITWDVIGLPPRFENPRKTSTVPYKVIVYKNAYNSDASPSGTLTIEPPDDLEGYDVNFLTNTRMMLTDATQNEFVLMYYLTSQMKLIGKLCQFNPGSVAACAEGASLFSEQIAGQRDAANLARYNQNNMNFPLFVYESTSSQWGNQQIFLSAYHSGITLVSTDNQQGQYHDINPTITMLQSGDTVVTGHRYNTNDGTSYCLIMQIYGPNLYPKYAAPHDQPWCFENNPDVYSIDNYNTVNILPREGGAFAEYWLNSTGHIIGLPFSLPDTNALMSSSTNELSNTQNIQYVVLGTVSVFFLLLGFINLMRVLCKEKLHNRNSDEADGLLSTTQSVELKYYGSGENSINRFIAYQPQLKQNSDNFNASANKI